MPAVVDITPIHEFLPCRTPQAWISEASKPDNLLILLTDHLNNELKAAQSAMSLISRYRTGFLVHTKGEGASPLMSASDQRDLLNKMSRLAREEMRHFEQVLAIMERRGMECEPLAAGGYASQLKQGVRTSEPGRLVDTLIMGAFIEARSCERFAVIAPFMDDDLGKFYRSLLKSEARHFQDYLKLAESISSHPIEDRVALFAGLEADAILSPDSEFRFHSGIPA